MISSIAGTPDCCYEESRKHLPKVIDGKTMGINVLKEERHEGNKCFKPSQTSSPLHALCTTFTTTYKITKIGNYRDASVGEEPRLLIPMTQI